MRRYLAILFVGFSAWLVGGLLCISAIGKPSEFKLLTETGRHVRVKGYLIYGFENRNLYQSPHWQEARDKNFCIPLGINSGNVALLNRAEKLSGSYVIVRGVTWDPYKAPPGREVVAPSFCHQIGIVVKDIMRASPSH